MRLTRSAVAVATLFTLFAGASVAFAVDKSSAPPLGSLTLSGKLLAPEPDPNDPNKGLSGPHEGPAGVPANDLCANAQSIAVPSSTAGTTVDATFDSAGTCTTTNTAPGVWYTFTPAVSGQYRASVCNAANYDSKISVFSGSCGGLACIGGNDDASGCGLTSQVDFTVAAGTPVYVLVHGFSSAVGDFTLDLSLLAAAPANDECSAAVPVAVPSTTAGTTSGAFVDSAFPQCGDNATTNPTAPGVWYEVTGTGNQMRASTCSQADYDTQLTVFCQDCATPTCINGNDDTVGCSGFSSQVDWESEVGATYRILVHGFSADNGDFDLSVSDLGIPSVAPVACLGPAGACCDPTTAACRQLSEVTCAINRGSWAEGLPCIVPVQTTSVARSPALAIPDNTPAGVFDTATVPDSGLVVEHVSVDVSISHTWIGDLRLALENVATGQTISLWERACDLSRFVNMNALFIDGGTTTLCVDVPPGGATIDPLVPGFGPPFATLDGILSAGDWRLIVSDNFAADVGTLDNWTLNVVEGQSVCYAYPAIQQIPTVDRKGLAVLALLLAGAAAFLIWRRRG